MTDVLIIAVLSAAELLIFELTGSLLPVKRGERSVLENICGGYVLYMALLEAAALAATVLECPLSVFARIWSGILSALVAFAVYRKLKGFGKSGERNRPHERPNAAAVSAAVCTAAFVCLAVCLPVVPDTNLVIGQMTQDLYHDAIGLFAPGTGERLTEMNAGTLLARYYVSDLVFCEISGIHPMAEMRIVRVGLTALVSSMAAYRALYRFFGNDRTKAGTGLMIYLVISLFFQRPYTVSGMMLSSGWTGNAAFAAVVVPVFLLLFISLYENPESVNLHILIVAAGIAAVSCSAQAALVFPFLLFAAGVAMILHTGDWLYLFRVILWLAVPVTALSFCLLSPAISV